jgi:hypothetical protein
MMLETLFYYFVIAIATPYEYCKAYRLNNEKGLYGLSLFAFLALWKVIPLSFNCAQCLIGLFGFSTLFFKSKIQKKDESLFVFAMLFLMLALCAFCRDYF